MKLSQGHVKWVLDNLLTLREGLNPKGKNTEPLSSIVGTRITEAVFIHHCETAGEVERRLNICGIDGYLLKQIYAWGESVEYLSKNLHISEREIEKGVTRAMEYITGKWPKRGYKEYKNHKGKGVTILRVYNTLCVALVGLEYRLRLSHKEADKVSNSSRADRTNKPPHRP